jgi:hypothetical protein
MTLRQRLFTNMFLRNMLGDFGNRSPYFVSRDKFIPYFQYRIGAYQPDHYLYFPKEPFALRYKNEIFNKLKEYEGYDIVKYLEFHYFAYPDKYDFLRFLLYETSQRVNVSKVESKNVKLQTVLEWVKEKQKENPGFQKQELRLQTEEEIGSFKNNDLPTTQNGHESLIDSLSNKLGTRVDVLMSETEKRMEMLTSSFLTGNIELNNQNHLDKLIQLFILISTVQAPSDLARGEQVFRRFSFTDLASLLHLHFEAFKNKKLNTIQVIIKERNETLNLKSPKVQKLADALRDFFY